jgi:hypothetical protein
MLNVLHQQLEAWAQILAELLAGVGPQPRLAPVTCRPSQPRRFPALTQG